MSSFELLKAGNQKEMIQTTLKLLKLNTFICLPNNATIVYFYRVNRNAM